MCNGDSDTPEAGFLRLPLRYGHLWEHCSVSLRVGVEAYMAKGSQGSAWSQGPDSNAASCLRSDSPWPYLYS